MALVCSHFLLSHGQLAPSFALPDAAGTIYDIDRCRGAKGLLVVFACNHCPYVIHIAQALGQLADEATNQGIGTVAINSNDLDRYPQDGPTEMLRWAKEWGWNFPYLLDSTQEIAKCYGAACTPDFYLFDNELRLAYMGQFDNSRPGNNTEVTGADLRHAIYDMLAGKEPKKGKPSSGCNIKWLPGNEPKWF